MNCGRRARSDSCFPAHTNSLLDGIPLVQGPTEEAKKYDQVLSKCWSFFLGNQKAAMRASSGWAAFGQMADVENVMADGAQISSRFAAALDARQLDHQLIISLPQESREDLIELWPNSLPARSLPIQISPQQLARDIKTIDLQWSLPPRSELKLALTASSEGAANRLAGQATTLIDSDQQWKSAFRVRTEKKSVNIESTGNPESPAFAIVLAEISNEVTQHRQQALRLQTMNRMKQIGLGLHNYHSAYGHFPLPATKNTDGRELLSWRVATAPFMGEQPIYQAIDRTQAWDSAANQKFTQTDVSGFHTPGVLGGKTAIRLPSITGSLWDGTHEKPQLREIADGTSNTIAVAIAPVDQAVPWTKPEVWQLDESDLIGSFFGDRDEVIVLSFDGAVHVITKAEMTNDRLRGLLTIAGREISDW